MLPEHYEDLITSGVEDRVMFGTDLPLQCALLDSLPVDMTKALSDIYADELKAVQAAGYSEQVMSKNFHRYLKG